MKIETHHYIVGLKIITSPIGKKKKKKESYVRLALGKIGSTNIVCP